MDAARLQERRRSCGPAGSIARNRRFEPCPELVLAQIAGARDGQPETLSELTYARGRRCHAHPACLCEHEPLSHLAKNAVALQRVVHQLVPPVISHHRRLVDTPCLRRLPWQEAVRAQVIDEATLARTVEDVRVRGLFGLDAHEGRQPTRLAGPHDLEKHEA